MSFLYYGGLLTELLLRGRVTFTNQLIPGVCNPSRELDDPHLDLLNIFNIFHIKI